MNFENAILSKDPMGTAAFALKKPRKTNLFESIRDYKRDHKRKEDGINPRAQFILIFAAKKGITKTEQLTDLFSPPYEILSEIPKFENVGRFKV